MICVHLSWSPLFVVCCPLLVLVKGPERLKKERGEKGRMGSEEKSSAFLGLCEFLFGGSRYGCAFNLRLLNELNGVIKPFFRILPNSIPNLVPVDLTRNWNLRVRRRGLFLGGFLAFSG